MPSSFDNGKCLRYYSPDDGMGFPTCGQLQGYLGSNLPCNAICDMIELLPNPVQPDGTQICLHPNKLRFFYRVTRTTPQVVQPNSLICAYDFPKTPTDGCWREFHKYCPQ